ncbi:hypothetical protein KEM52_000746 [Ascosphaera acerosa]|nr:hypothetical protein KEM52_000746 [Ascosphaera acerosa]
MRLPKQCKPGGLRYCSRMRLVAVASVDEQVNVYRANGQQVLGGVYGTPPRGGGPTTSSTTAAPAADGNGDDDIDDSMALDDDEARQVTAVAWRPDGKYLAVVCSDHSLRIVSTANAKTVHHLTREADSQASSSQAAAVPTFLAWTTNFTDTRGSMSLLAQQQDQDARETAFDLHSLLDCEAKLSDLRHLRGDLPRELMLLDVESSLPRLSTLPSTHHDQDVFSTRNSVDAIFHGPRKTGDTVDVLLMASTDGSINLKINSCFEIGSVSLQDSLRASHAHLVTHSSHPLTTNHALLFRVPRTDPAPEPCGENAHDNALRLVVADLAFVTASGRYLSIVASKATQLHNLLRYIKQTQAQTLLEWKNVQDLQARYLRSANMGLQEQFGCSFIDAAYHLAVTGDCWTPLREFLTDIVGDRGHKRWDKAVTTGLEAIRAYAHDCLLPALERAGVHLHTLKGLSKFHKVSGTLGLWTDDLRACEQTLHTLTVFTHKVIVHSSAELRGFKEFSQWLRLQIHIQMAEPLSQTQHDLLQKSDTVDYVATLGYLTGPLANSLLRGYLGPTGLTRADPYKWEGQEEAPVTDDAQPQRTLLERFKAACTQHDAELQQCGETAVRLPSLTDLTSRLASQFAAVTARIAAAQSRMIYHRCPFEVPDDCDAEACDAVITYQIPDSVPVPCVYVAARARSSQHTVRIYCVPLGLARDGRTSSSSSSSSSKAVAVASVSLPSGRVTAIKLLGDGVMLLLWQDQTSDARTHLLQVSYNQSKPDCAMHYTPVSAGTEHYPPAADLDPLPNGESGPLVRHTFQHDRASEPAHIHCDEAGEGTSSTLCVLSADRASYRVLEVV